MALVNVSVLRGGESSMYEESLKTGLAVIKSLPAEHYEIKDIFIDRLGKWHFEGTPVQPDRILRQTDVVFNALHAEGAEDGKIHRILNGFALRYTGVDLSSLISIFALLHKSEGALNMNVRAGDAFEKSIHELCRGASPPFVVRPVCGWPKKNTFAHSVPELYEAVRANLCHTTAGMVSVKKYRSGRRIICVVIEKMRGERYYTLPLAEISEYPTESLESIEYSLARHAFYLPVNLPREEKEAIENQSKNLFADLSLRHYALFEFSLPHKKKADVHDILPLPALGKDSIFSKLLDSTGISMREFCEHVLNLAIDR
jgi:D-alanine-D-alanine ligase